MEYLIDTSLTFFWFIITISVIVFIHEFGHFFFARLYGVRIEVFSIGFGKELFGWTDKLGTRWKIAVLPLGGYVKMFGDADPTSSPDLDKIKEFSEEEKELSFYYKPLWQKSVIVAAGPLANYALAIVIFTLMFFTYGKAYLVPEVGSVIPRSAAEKAGLKVGDIIASVDGNNIESFNELKELIILNTGTPIKLVIKRNSKVVNITLTPEIRVVEDKLGGKAKLAFLGVASKKIEYLKLNFAESAYESLKQTYVISTTMLKGIGQIIIGQRSTDEIGGPVKIAKYSKESADDGLLGLLWFIALLSINLGLINLFPIPLLDGGHLTYYIIETLQGKPLSHETQNHGFRIGFILLVSLMLFAIFNDVKFLLGY